MAFPKSLYGDPGGVFWGKRPGIGHIEKEQLLSRLNRRYGGGYELVVPSAEAGDGALNRESLPPQVLGRVFDGDGGIVEQDQRSVKGQEVSGPRCEANPRLPKHGDAPQDVRSEVLVNRPRIDEEPTACEGDRSDIMIESADIHEVAVP